MKKRRSLDSFFKRETRRWSLVGFGLTIIFSIPCLVYSEKVASERQLLTVARAGATAFRPLILEGNIRDAQIQMREALALQPEESAVVRDPNLKLIYSVDPNISEKARCSASNIFCWARQFGSVSTLYPIYFDEPERKSLFGYLEVTLKPALDTNILWCLFILVLAAFVGQSIGMSKSLSNATVTLSKLFTRWSEHLKRSPMRSLPVDGEAPFSEMKDLEAAVNGLHLEIERLQEQAAKEAKASAHFSLLREIGHDLRTPHSQLARHFALLVDTVKAKSRLDVQEVGNVERSIKRMGELIRQVRTLSVGQKSSDNSRLAGFNLQTELRTLVEDLRLDPEIIDNKIEIDFQDTDILPPVRMTALEFYRIIENIVRNAVVAVMETPSPKIEIRLGIANGRPSLSILDNGFGIAPEIQSRIFDFNFTTKPSRGTGLGLGIVKHICDQYNADLSFTSDVNSGTEFKIIFSLKEEIASVLGDSRREVYG